MANIGSTPDKQERRQTKRAVEIVENLGRKGAYEEAVHRSTRIADEGERLAIVLRLCGELGRQIRRMRPAVQLATGQHAKSLEAEFHKLLSTLEDATVEAARIDPVIFAEYVFGFKCAGIHRDWHAAYPRVAANGLKELSPLHRWEVVSGAPRLVLVSSRGHGKSTQMAEVRTLWEIGRNPNLLIKIVCASDQKAKERVALIRNFIESHDKLHRVFPELQPGDTWTKQALIVKRTLRSAHASIEARGVMSTATGGRGDLIVGDDVCDRRNTLLHPGLRVRVREAWNDDWMNVLNPPGRVVYIATPWHESDLTEHLRRTPGYHTIFQCINENLDPIWPERFPREELQRKRKQIGSIAFSRGYHCQPLTGDIQCVLPEWIQYVDDCPEGRYAHFMGYDPASSLSGEADYCGAVIVSVHLESMVGYVRYAAQFRRVFPEQVRFIQETHRAWQFTQIAIEEYSYQTSLRQQIDARTPMPMVGMRPRESKQLRLQAISPYLESGKIKFHASLHPSRYIAKEPDEIDLVTQLTRFPLARYDDLVDAFVYAATMAANYYLEASLAEEAEYGDNAATAIQSSVSVLG
ncbi:MAG TPA: hypothetical protein VFH61_18225 [Thermoleophilia bacterium]|nr:hypothetical protein [Thermoleophilia bacterium]